MGDNPFVGMTLTNHGETRIKKCIKYDLTGYARLITIQDSGIVLFCFAGTHDDCDRWLEQNRGFTLAANESNQLISVQTSETLLNLESRLTGPSALTTGKLYRKIPEKYFDKLVELVPRAVTRELEALESTCEETEIYLIAQKISDAERGLAIAEVFILLRQDKEEEAIDRTKLFLGETKLAEQLTEEEIAALADSQTIKTLSANDPKFQRVFEHFVQSASYMDWMLFLHPDQEYVVNRDFQAPAKLVGVSGSGKTCIVVQRAIRLAQTYSNDKILILTLNKPLARLIEDMVTAASLEEIRERIDVMPFFKLCQNLLLKHEPQSEKLYDDITWKSREHIDEIWREFYRCEVNNHEAEVLLPIHDSLIARRIDAEQYIREEFDWIRSALPVERRSDCLTIDRSGRSYPLDQNFRHSILAGLEAWERKMRAVGVTDYLGIATALYKYKDKLEPLYRCILIDESQDFGTIEYEMISTLAKTGKNNLFFCGDAAQQVSAKHRSFRDAGISIASKNSLKIQKNYRNSRESLRAAYDVLWNNLNEEMLGSVDFEILDPEYANFSAAPPLLLQANTIEDEIAYALGYLKDASILEPNSKACIAFCGYSLYRIQKFGNRVGIPVLDGSISIENDNFYLSDLEHTKGFEFDTMIIVNCNEGIIPDPLKPEQEQFRDLARFYVAMTRAKNQLIVSFSVARSSLLIDADANFLMEEWANYVSSEYVTPRGLPPTLDDIRHENYSESGKDLLDMSGPEFLYTSHGIGIDASLIGKLRDLVPGTSRTRGGAKIQWETLRKAKIDTDRDVRSRQAFGPEGIKKFRELIGRL